MCGIFGICNKSGVDETWLYRMSDIIRHRGPDDRGFFLDGRFGFGMNRLSIIDLASGHQPIFNENEDLSIVFNGEIYNYKEISEKLKTNGHIFKTNSDTETILHLFEERGTDAFSDLRGMFGIAIWDKKKRELILCRDRLGKKPLYYYHKDGRFAFASEIKSLLTLPFVSREINYRALDSYLAFQYIPGPMTIFEGIWKLQPGFLLRFKDGDVRTSKYWELPPYTSEYHDEKDCIDKARDLLREAVQARLISEVPLGAFLSGGLDSSAIVALMAEASARPIKTFSVGFEDAGYNELEFARVVARHFNTDHHEITVKADAAELLPRIVWHLDEPMADPAILPTYQISEYARRYVKVVLTGEGGDEVFAGYTSYIHQKYAYLYQTFVPSIIRMTIEKIGPRILKDRRLRQGIWFYSRPVEETGAWRIVFNPAERLRLYQSDVSERLYGYDPTRVFVENYSAGTGNFIDRMLQADTLIWLPDDLLMKVDKMSMAHSLEARAPFLDHHLVEYMARVSTNLKLKGSEGKYVFKKAMEGILPDSIIYRKKHGFDLPIDKWLKTDLKTMIDGLLSYEKVESGGIFRADVVREIIEKQRKGIRGYHKQVWSLLVFQLWRERFLE